MLIQDVLEHNARTHPSRLALISAKEEVTYRELRDRVRGCAGCLPLDVTIPRDDRPAGHDIPGSPHESLPHESLPHEPLPGPRSGTV